jgi:uncharacterized protein (TIGR00251 family)
MAAWWRLDADRNILCIQVYVQPNARATEVAGVHGDALKVRLAAPPVDQRANLLLVDFLSKALALPSNAISIKRGRRGRSKLVEIAAPGPAALAAIRAWERT